MSIIIVFFIILFISLIGFNILRFFLFDKKDILFAIGSSYGLGVGCVGLQLYLYTRFNIEWQREFILTPWIIFLVINFFIKRNRISLSLPKFPTIQTIKGFLLVGIFLSLTYVFFEATLRPVVVWDAWANWLMQSKAFFIEGGIKPQTLQYLDSEYPLTINLLGTFIYIVLGKVDDTAVLLTSFAFYLFLAITFFAALKQITSTRLALLFTFLLVTTQNFVRHGGRLEAGLADLPLGYFAFISVILLFTYLKQYKVKILVLLSGFLSITALIKFEGIPLTFFIAVCTIFYIFRQKLYSHLLIIIFWIIPFLGWQVDRRILGLQETYFSSAHTIEVSFKKTINAFWGTLKELLNFKSWNLLWLTYFYSLVAFGFKGDRRLTILHFIILSQFVTYMVIYNFTAGNNPESSIERLLMHIAPLVFYSLAIIMKKKILK